MCMCVYFNEIEFYLFYSTYKLSISIACGRAQMISHINLNYKNKLCIINILYHTVKLGEKK